MVPISPRKNISNPSTFHYFPWRPSHPVSPEHLRWPSMRWFSARHRPGEFPVTGFNTQISFHGWFGVPGTPTLGNLHICVFLISPIKRRLIPGTSRWFLILNAFFFLPRGGNCCERLQFQRWWSSMTSTINSSLVLIGIVWLCISAKIWWVFNNQEWRHYILIIDMLAVDFGHQEKLVDLGGSVSPMSVLGVFHRRTYGNWPTNRDMMSQTADTLW